MRAVASTVRQSTGGRPPDGVLRPKRDTRTSASRAGSTGARLPDGVLGPKRDVRTSASRAGSTGARLPDGVLGPKRDTRTSASRAGSFASRRTRAAARQRPRGPAMTSCCLVPIGSAGACRSEPSLPGRSSRGTPAVNGRRDRRQFGAPRVWALTVKSASVFVSVVPVRWIDFPSVSPAGVPLHAVVVPEASTVPT